jgi:hypothetical protein
MGSGMNLETPTVELEHSASVVGCTSRADRRLESVWFTNIPTMNVLPIDACACVCVEVCACVYACFDKVFRRTSR